MELTGIHHLTAVSAAIKENHRFYTQTLGMRLVKRSVNQDDPGTYHLFYADAEGHPGTDLTFFPWTHHAPPRVGHGLAVEVALEVPAGSLDYWTARLEKYGTHMQARERRFGDTVVPATDPHGLNIALVESGRGMRRPFTPWDESPVPPERQVRGLYGAQIWEREAAPSATFLTSVLGFELIGSENGWTRYGFAGEPGVIDIRETRDERRGAWGVGSVHHLAWSVKDDSHQLAISGQVESAGGQATEVIDRFWFKSVYFKEPGGVLFEIATEGPGFAADEDPAHLGESLVLPPWLESHRPAIERSLPSLTPIPSVRS